MSLLYHTPGCLWTGSIVLMLYLLLMSRIKQYAANNNKSLLCTIIAFLYACSHFASQRPCRLVLHTTLQRFVSEESDLSLAYRQHHLHCNYGEEKGHPSQVRGVQVGKMIKVRIRQFLQSQKICAGTLQTALAEGYFQKY